MVSNNKISLSALVSGLVLFSCLAANVHAATITASCEYRADSEQERSKADVKVKGLLPGGVYSVSISGVIGPAQVASAAGEVESSFDSNPKDIAAGDIGIVPGALASGSATFIVRNALAAQVATGTVTCRVR
ncbi:hypothetical protein [Methylobacter sp.]|uniref:hypothetical protein n=1 Tax=Methylobacter sp. TaxID=2051955 RepID=UPI00122A8609|nr:hypothetical protein [Methylobacter sp.]TAK64353.1 MAG: hypothetical protein EPO18_03640 [Methylobacter sp.]